MRRLELAVLLAGVAAIVLALGSVDWRLGLFVLGVALIASTLDLRRTP